MNKTDHFTARFVESFPTSMESGILYVSMSYAIAAHVCPCGCGREVVTKLSPARWRVIYDGEVSLMPSIASTGLPCNSHYFITRGDVDWRYELDAVQAARARAADSRALEDHRAQTTIPGRGARLWRRLWHRRA